MRFFIVDDDVSIIHVLSLIIENRYLGKVVGSAENGAEALEKMSLLQPDIVIADLLMPIMDGITFVKKARQMNTSAVFIMLSQVSSKEMVESAYESGVKFYIQKPINSIEVEKVIKLVSQNISYEKELTRLSKPKEESKDDLAKVKTALDKMGIIGETGSRDILSVVSYIRKNKKEAEKLPLNTLCSRLSDNPKTLEQRIRRLAFQALSNLASLGLENNENEVFKEYACSLFGFEQIKKEMDFIRGESKTHGKISIKAFLQSLSFLPDEKE